MKKGGRLRDGIIALGAMQLVNMAIPLVTAPYLTRVLGVESYGKVALVQVVLLYFTFITDYGYTWSATQRIAEAREDKAAISAVFNATWCAQWILLCIALLLLAILVVCVPWMRQSASMLGLGGLLVLGNVLFPSWLFQGLERMREVAVLQISGRLLSIPLLFLFVRNERGGAMAIAALGAGSVIAGGASMLWIRRARLVNFSLPSADEVRFSLREGAGLFISRISISAYTALTPILLGTCSGVVQLAYFALADKIRGAAQSSLNPVSTALFPRMSYLYKRNVSGAENLLRLSIVMVFLLAGSISVLLWVLAPWLVAVLGGAQFSQSTNVLHWLSPLPLVIGLSNVFGVQVMLPNKFNNAFNTIIVLASVLSLLLIWPMSRRFGAIGAAQTWLVAELFVTINMGLYIWKKGCLKTTTLS